MVVLAAVGYGVGLICRRPRRVSIVFRENFLGRPGAGSITPRPRQAFPCRGHRPLVSGVVEGVSRVRVNPKYRLGMGNGVGRGAMGKAAPE